MVDIEKPKLKADETLIFEAGRLASARSEIKQQRDRENDARNNILAQLPDLNIEVVGENDESLLTVSEQLRPGSIDWSLFMEEHPDFDYDAYRKPASVVVTVRTGPAAQYIDIDVVDVVNGAGEVVAQYDKPVVPDVPD